MRYEIRHVILRHYWSLPMDMLRYVSGRATLRWLMFSHADAVTAGAARRPPLDGAVALPRVTGHDTTLSPRLPPRSLSVATPPSHAAALRMCFATLRAGTRRHAEITSRRHHILRHTSNADKIYREFIRHAAFIRLRLKAAMR